MNSNIICPISNNRIDENIARLNAAQTVVLLVLFLLSFNLIPIFLLIVDFVLRSSGQSAYSPLAIVSKKLHKILKLKSKPVNAGPKIFACSVGVVFSVIVALSASLAFVGFAFVVASIFAICAFLEAAFSFCIACRIYPFVYKFRFIFAK